jgi:hypothetical protein
VRTTLVLGVSASVAANILHANPNPISQSISAWPPLALLLTVELVSRVPVHRRSLAVIRLLATTVIAGIAAWVSYWHMQGVAARYGETDASPYLLPISVDGLIVVASICLVELAGRIREHETDRPMPVAAPAVVETSHPAPNGHKPPELRSAIAPHPAPPVATPAVVTASAVKSTPWAAPPPRPRTT